jgi:hypothetical protein
LLRDQMRDGLELADAHPERCHVTAGPFRSGAEMHAHAHREQFHRDLEIRSHCKSVLQLDKAEVSSANEERLFGL